MIFNIQMYQHLIEKKTKGYGESIYDTKSVHAQHQKQRNSDFVAVFNPKATVRPPTRKEKLYTHCKFKKPLAQSWVEFFYLVNLNVNCQFRFNISILQVRQIFFVKKKMFCMIMVTVLTCPVMDLSKMTQYSLCY